MQRVLGIIGSPRKNGNTHHLVSRILDGVTVGGGSAEKIILANLRIGECTGCDVCRADKPCVLGDDMNDLYQKILDADTIVFGTPVYWYGPTALMKAFIDRFYLFNNPSLKQPLKGKSAVLAIPCEENSMECIAPVVSFFERSIHYLDMRMAGQVLAPGNNRKGDILYQPEVLEEAYQIGLHLASHG